MGRDRDGQQRGLRVFSEFQVFLRTLKAQPGEREPQCVVRFLKRPSRLGTRFAQGPAHTGGLGALAREKKSSFTHEITILSAVPFTRWSNLSRALFAFCLLGVFLATI